MKPRPPSLLTEMVDALRLVLDTTGGSQHWHGETGAMLRNVERVLDRVRSEYPTLLRR